MTGPTALMPAAAFMAPAPLSTQAFTQASPLAAPAAGTAAGGVAWAAGRCGWFCFWGASGTSGRAEVVRTEPPWDWWEWRAWISRRERRGGPAA